MSNKEIITEIIEDLESTVGLNWPNRKSKINREKLIECWSKYRNKEYEFYGYLDQNSTTKIYKKIFRKVEKNNRKSWKIYILGLYNYRYCTICKTLKIIDKFYINTKNICKICYKEESKKYYETHKEEAFARSALRRALKLQRTPEWVNLEEIKKIYKKCPIGYHVDHIIPLEGELVSGLHIAENLQYLTAHDNLAKSNKFEVN